MMRPMDFLLHRYGCAVARKYLRLSSELMELKALGMDDTLQAASLDLHIKLLRLKLYILEGIILGS